MLRIDEKGQFSFEELEQRFEAILPGLIEIGYLKESTDGQFSNYRLLDDVLLNSVGFLRIMKTKAGNSFFQNNGLEPSNCIINPNLRILSDEALECLDKGISELELLLESTRKRKLSYIENAVGDNVFFQLEKPGKSSLRSYSSISELEKNKAFRASYLNGAFAINRLGGSKITLLPAVAELLQFFLDNPREIISRELILKHFDMSMGSDWVDMNASRIRKVFCDIGLEADLYLQTHEGAGYSLGAPR